MTMYALLRNSPVPSIKELDSALQGNLCRCTGYRPVLEAYKTFTKEFGVSQTAVCAMGEQCCKNRAEKSNNCNTEEQLFEVGQFMPLDPSQEPIFPPELKLSKSLDIDSIVFRSGNISWYRPAKLEHLLALKKCHPATKIVVGNTEVGIEVKFKHYEYSSLAYVAQIKELCSVEKGKEGLKIGASVTISEMERILKEEIDTSPESETRLYKAIVEMIHWFAGTQIRNVASVGGNIVTSSPISDLNPIFAAAGVE